MAETWGQQITIPGLVVVGTLASKQFHFVKMASTAGTVVALTASTNLVIGILQDKPSAAGEAATVAAVGVSLVVAGTSLITKGALLTPNSTGQATTGGVRGYARAIEASNAIGDEIRCILNAVGTA